VHLLRHVISQGIMNIDSDANFNVTTPAKAAGASPASILHWDILDGLNSDSSYRTASFQDINRSVMISIQYQSQKRHWCTLTDRSSILDCHIHCNSDSYFWHWQIQLLFRDYSALNFVKCINWYHPASDMDLARWWFCIMFVFVSPQIRFRS